MNVLPVYRPHNFGLGDHWATVSLCRFRGRQSGEPLRLATRSHGRDFSQRLHEIDDLLDDSDCGPRFIDAEPTHHFDGYHIWACPVVPTKTRWRNDPRSRAVVYQFDGESAAESKNPPDTEREKLLAWLRNVGFETVQLGKHLSLAECVEEAANAALFVGVDSGMSHVAHSVGVPVYLYEHKLPIITCHRQKQFVIVRSADDFIAQVWPYLHLRFGRTDAVRP